MEPEPGGPGGARPSRTTSLLVVLVAVLVLAVAVLGTLVLRDDDDSQLTSSDVETTAGDEGPAGGKGDGSLPRGDADDADADDADGDGRGGEGGGGGGGSGGAGSGGGGDGGGGDGGGGGDDTTTTSSTSTTTSSDSTATTAFGDRVFPTFGTIPPAVQLDPSLPAVAGSTALTSGFVPDPFLASVPAGGPVNVSYLGGGCTGRATAAPTFSVNYTAGAFPLLRFFAVSTGADLTMVINTPSSSFVCVDDSFGTLNPTIDFNSPASGRYDVWIGTFEANVSATATLNVTESSGNRP